MIKLSYFPNLFIEAAVLFDQQGLPFFCVPDVMFFMVSDWTLKRRDGMLKSKMGVEACRIGR